MSSTHAGLHLKNEILRMGGLGAGFGGAAIAYHAGIPISLLIAPSVGMRFLTNSSVQKALAKLGSLAKGEIKSKSMDYVKKLIPYVYMSIPARLHAEGIRGNL